MFNKKLLTVMYDPEKKDLVLSDEGNILLSKNLTSEIIRRLTAWKNTYLYNPSYGSNFYLLVGTRIVLDPEIEAILLAALDPLITSGKILPTLTFNIKAATTHSFTIKLICYSGDNEKLSIQQELYI